MKAVDLLRLKALVDAFRSKGHQVASLDPLYARTWRRSQQAGWVGQSLAHWRVDPEAQRLADLMDRVKDHDHRERDIDMAAAGFSADTSAVAVVPPDALLDIVGPHAGTLASGGNGGHGGGGGVTVGDVLETMHQSYCGTVSAEFVHVQTTEQFHWLSQRLETPTPPSAADRRNAWRQLARADHFERYLRAKYKATKTFGLMGCESLIPGMHALCERASALGVEHIELGMPHRGRLNMLVNVLRKPIGDLFDEINDDGTAGHVSDVKYHLGARASITYPPLPGQACDVGGRGSGSRTRELRLSLVPNPSHLELVGPVVLGKTRAVQHFTRDMETRSRAMPVLLHGDAAFSGQGITAETLELSQLPDYTVGGTVHVILNNQIGFTTDPHISRSSLHPTGAATAVGAPVLHVNGDDAEGVVRCFRLATEYRQRFHQDCVIDIVCYRREGHNEQDDPTVTQPGVYRDIAMHPTSLEIYQAKLADEGVIHVPRESNALREATLEEYEHEFQMRRGGGGGGGGDGRTGHRSITDISGNGAFEGDAPATSSTLAVPFPAKGGAGGRGGNQLRRSPSINSQWLSSNWKGRAMGDMVRKGDRPYNMTGVAMETLKSIGRALGPNSVALRELALAGEPLELHPAVHKIMAARERNVCGEVKSDDNGEQTSLEEEDDDDEEDGDKRGRPGVRTNDRHKAKQFTVDMATAEALAMGALVLPLRGDTMPGTAMDAGYTDHPTVHVRLSGQDSERGTFNQRHAVVVCQQTERRFVPLNGIAAELAAESVSECKDGDGEGTPSQPIMGDDGIPRGQESVKVANSNLSEAAVLAFEYGHSLENERCLTVWEAQFGDFANNAQAVIDNMIVSGEHKWGANSGLVLLLPHGFEGQGPEHSSCRLERFLQLVDDDPDDVPGFSLELVSELREAFARADTNSDGFVDRDELYGLLLEGARSRMERAPGPAAAAAGAEGDRGHMLLMNEIANPMLRDGGADGGAARPQRFSCEDYIKYTTTWIRRNYETQYNMSVVNVTTPAQYFHVLRRQIHRPFVKPLVLASPKWLHHHAPARSRLSDMGPGTWFRRIISEKSRANNVQVNPRLRFQLAPAEDVRRLIICSGKVFYELYRARTAKAQGGKTEQERRDARLTSLVRLEQLAPFPMDRVASAVNGFPGAEVVGVQEEPKNQGAWSFVQPRFATAMRYFYRGPGDGAEPPTIAFLGRPVSATTAGGSFRDHAREQQDLIRRALDLSIPL